ncbi:nucleotidyltransferase family protein [Lichenihabitans sp. Uapishka_5]|uniref:nucleotidyltransferase family protein n=1 Tax=Lichenihabitans sp. Uapishka_5 TaxID=3037302 RepID=UPI0029E7D91A|nr:nucleotidyltransferase family protein [Lichenihabitans sp. Uapishka_5]MDX7949603.1 nucleotidyltransferase family protein [Lichenihabitans sp. Uapishka_5]
MTPHAIVLLAAGRATRYRAAGGPEPTKLLAAWRGEPLVRHAARAALESRAAPVIVVTGHAAEAVLAALAGLAVRPAHNPAFAEGLATSLQVGIAAVPPACPGALVMLADMPAVTPAILDALLDAALASPDASAVVPSYGGIRGNPVVLSRTLFPAVHTLRGDVGARQLLRDPALRVIEVALSDAGIAHDMDAPADLSEPLTKA